MFFWYILFVVSFVAVFTIPMVRMPKLESLIITELNNKRFKRAISNFKKTTLTIGISLSKNFIKGLVLIYSKGVSKIKSTKVSNFLEGRGVLVERDSTSDFLKDVKEHRDKVREELTNGVPEDIK